MRKIYFIISSLALISFNYGCRQETLAAEQSTPNNIQITDGYVKDGRLYFANKESLQHYYDNVKNEKDEIIAKYIDSKGIISLRPIVTEQNEQIILAKTQARINALKDERLKIQTGKIAGVKNMMAVVNDEQIKDDIDDLEDIIGDDAFAAFLNNNGEIQVDNKIYKYTDVGLFIVSDNKYSVLQQYLATNNISNNLLISTDPEIREGFIDNNTNPTTGPGGWVDPNRDNTPVITAITPDIGYFCPYIPRVYPPKQPDTNPPKPAPVPIDPEVAVNNFVNSLPKCDTYRTWLQSIFGDSDMCVDKYESHRRVKTKAYNQNYYLVYNIGVQVKHQYKGWTGLWRKEKADEIRLGVTASEFHYDYTPYLSYLVPKTRQTNVYNNGNRLLFNAASFWSPGYYPGSYTMTGYSIQNYPKIFQDDIYIEDIVPFIGNGSNIDLIDKGLYAAAKAGNNVLAYDKLNQLFWDEVMKRTGNLWQSLGKPKPSNNVTYSYSVPEFGKLYIHKMFYRKENNVSYSERTFDWGFQIGFNIGSDGSISPNTSASGLIRPKGYKVRMYGIAKKNGAWHGSKIDTFE
ncbi:hypothetical protein HZQ28_17970 [Elizabethkingia anophelis]|uniref:hypothetical protein n=1 Tax=Elizabethkingia meningoseptica TaxID=238 RepID=UPI001629AA29|nr:hypothetical protein [Elizabethkingia meningoseptica]MCT3649863.1 hypothetical protein [Elizabethkingia anophelis]MCT3697069.1 hypothetical protein [Elizabethkingia anophelis]MCT3861024.1 hypothetical protein [Elizabethkingia anophelis]MCT3946813.1 hypothetical protein [Elizabethkingia anophelis]MCT3996375.1 hypothetical protein [Elizabethkingia anophelis]